MTVKSKSVRLILVVILLFALHSNNALGQDLSHLETAVTNIELLDSNRGPNTQYSFNFQIEVWPETSF